MAKKTTTVAPLTEVEKFSLDSVSRRNELVTASKQMAAWEVEYTEQQFLHQSKNPIQVIDMLNSDPSKKAVQFTPIERAAASDFYGDLSAIPQKRSQFVQEIEQLAAANGGEVPLDWFVQYTAADMKRIGADTLGVDIKQFVIREKAMADHLEAKRIVEEATDRRYEAELRGQTNPFARVFGFGPLGADESKKDNIIENFENIGKPKELPDRDKIEAEEWLKVVGRRDQIFDEEIGIFEVKRQKAMLEDPVLRARLLGIFEERLQEFKAGATQAGGIEVETEAEFEFLVEQEILSGELEVPEGWTDALQNQLDQEINGYRQLIIDGGDVTTILRQHTGMALGLNLGLELFNVGMGVAFTGAGGLLWALDAAFPGSNLGTVIETPDSIFGHKVPTLKIENLPFSFSWLSPSDWLVARQLNETKERQNQARARLGVVDDDAIFAAASKGLIQAFKDMPEDNPEAYGEYILAAGNDESIAFGIFAQGMLEQDEVKEKLSQQVQLERTRDERLIEALQDRDFRFSEGMLDILGMWGRNGPMRIATAFTLLMQPSDYWSDLYNGQMIKVWHELGEDVEKHGFSPASVYGIEGSLSGLMLDLGLGIFFDPTTWIFGPRLGANAAKYGGITTAAQAAKAARSPVLLTSARDMVKFSLSSSRGMGATYRIARWLDGIGIAELFDATGFVKKALPDRKWVNHKTGAKAMEVDVSFLKQIADEADLAKLTSKQKIKLADDIKEQGFLEAGEIVYSRSTDTWHMTDGTKRLSAALDSGVIRQVPVSLRIVDDAAFGKTILSGFDAAEGAVVKLVSEGKASTRLKGSVVTKGADEGARKFVAKSAGIVKDSGAAKKVGSITIKNGEVVEVVSSLSGGSVGYYAYTADGKLVAGVSARAGKVTTKAGGINMAVMEGFSGKVMEQIWDLAATRGDHFVLQSGMSGSISGQATSFGQRYAQKLMTEAQNTLSTVGIKTADLIGSGNPLKKRLKKLGQGDNVVRPDKLLTMEKLLGGPTEEALIGIMERALLRGALPGDWGHASVSLSTWAGKARNILRNGTPEEIARWVSQQKTTTSMALRGPNAIRDAMDQTIKIWGRNQSQADIWLSRFAEHQRAITKSAGDDAAKLASLEPLRKQLASIQDELGVVSEGMHARAVAKLEKSIDELGALGGNEGAALEVKLHNLESKRLKLETKADEARKYLEAKELRVRRTLEEMNGNEVLQKLLLDMWDDFNRVEIYPRWKKTIAKERAKKNNGMFDDKAIKLIDDGIAPWEFLRKGGKADGASINPDKGFRNAESLRDLVVKGEKITDIEALSKYLGVIEDIPMVVNLPMSSMDITAAATLSGKAYSRFTHVRGVSAVRDLASKLNQFWKIDKVLRFSTAATVSADELLRIFHSGGWLSVKRYLDDRILYTQARIHTRMNPELVGGFFGRQSPQRGATQNPRIQARMEEMRKYVMKDAEWERVFFDDHGLGWSDIVPSSPEYAEAARRWTGNIIQETGFRAFMRGEKAFAEWFNGIDGARMREATVMKKTDTGMVRTEGLVAVEEAFQGWQTYMDLLTKRAEGAGRKAEVMEAFRTTAAKVDASPNIPINLPESMFDGVLGDVRGTLKHRPKGSGGGARFSTLSEQFFDRFFLDPVNYRRGLLASMVENVEKARLEDLFASQGKRILSDLEVETALNLKNIAGANQQGIREYLWEQALKQDIVPQSYVDDLIQRRVDMEIDHTLYVAERGSIAGRALNKSVLPFGKPFADMAAYWGREMIRRPVIRGLDNTNFIMNKIPQGFSGLSVNPRTPALISRLANQDFKIDRGYTGTPEGTTAGLIPGSESTDFSPLMFLPTGGDNPFGAVLPGLGYLPLWMLDLVVMNKYDPLTQPLEYKNLLAQVSDILPSMNFGSPDAGMSLIQRTVGGGSAGQFIEATLDLIGIKGGTGGGFAPLLTMFGQIDREIDRGRSMSSILYTDTDLLADLMEEDTEAGVILVLDGLAMKSDTKASLENLAENVSKFAIPTTNKFNGDLDTIFQIWVDAGTAFPVLAGVVSPFDDSKATPEQRRTYADKVRRAFFDLPQWERDRLIVEQPTIAINLVSSWDWTQAGRESFLPGSTIAYKTGGSLEELALHDVYVKSGFITPLSPVERTMRVLGLMLSAKESTAVAAYERSAQIVNSVLWDFVVPDDVKDYLQLLFDRFPELESALDVRDARELWLSWGRYEDEVEDFVARALGVDTDSKEFEVLKGRVNVMNKYKAWSPDWPGINPEGLSGRYSDVTFSANMLSDPRLKSLATTVGVELTPGMSGEALYGSLQQYVTAQNSALKVYVDPAYQTYIGARSQTNRAVDTQLRRTAFAENVDPRWSKQVLSFMSFEDSISRRWRDTPLGVPAEDQLKVQDQFMRMVNSSKEALNLEWDVLWEKRYERSFGPLGWLPPNPAVWNEGTSKDPRVSNDAYKPFVSFVIDGDSLIVRDREGSHKAHEVRLLGVRARDFGFDNEGAITDKERLTDALMRAKQNGDTIYLVRDPETFGAVDPYGRELAWLWIGDEPFWFSDEMLPNRDLSGVPVQTTIPAIPADAIGAGV